MSECSRSAVYCASAVVPCIDLGGQSLAAYRGDRGSIPDKSFGVYGG
jgi:hypothetical protein